MYALMNKRVNKYEERRSNKEVRMKQTGVSSWLVTMKRISKRVVDVAATTANSNKFSKNKQYRFN